jgi:serine/threonine-protein kinase
LKTLLADERLDPDALKRFEREATAASALGHPGIIAVHDFNRDAGGTRYLVMDLLEGETLEQRLRRLGSLPWPAAQRIALEIGSALVVAHGAGLLHRDLKPANIFLARSTGAEGERAVLLDFGLVKPLDPNAATLTASGAALGTPLYMAPEQARGEACDVRTDIHGLGMVIFEMVAGVTPYHDKTLPNVIARLLTTPAPAPSTVAKSPVPPGLDATLGYALSKSREGRYPSMSAFVEAVRVLG